MPLELETVEEYAKLVSRLEEWVGSAATGQANVIVFVEGNHLPETGKSWCPDCAKGTASTFHSLIQ